MRAVAVAVVMFFACGTVQAQPGKTPVVAPPSKSLLLGIWRAKPADSDSPARAVWTFSSDKLTVQDGPSLITVPYQLVINQDKRFKLRFEVFFQQWVASASIRGDGTMLVRLSRDNGEPVLLVLSKDAPATRK
jgi:hypothetical protein